MNKILITGGAGFIGYHLAKELSKDSNNIVFIWDNLCVGKKDKYLAELRKIENIKFHRMELEKIDEVNIANNSFNRVYHLADLNEPQTRLMNPYKVLYDNIRVTMKVLNWVAKNDIEKLLFASSCEVYYDLYQKEIARNYKKNPKAKFIEDDNLSMKDVCNPFNNYEISKLVCEKLITNYCEKHFIKYNIARLGNVFGERMIGYNKIQDYLKRTFKYKRQFPINTPHYKNTYYYVADAVRDLITLMEGYPSGTVNIGSNELISNNDIIEYISILSKEKYKLVVDNKSRSFFYPESFCPETRKFEHYFGEMPKTQFAVGFQKVYKWYKKEGIFDDK